VFKPDKINYELLGNGCPHIHWNLYPSDEVRKDYINRIKNEIEKLLALKA
jgi:hypothetical protein